MPTFGNEQALEEELLIIKKIKDFLQSDVMKTFRNFN